LRSGEPLRAPALSPVSCWSVAQRDGKIFVTGKKEPAPSPKPQATDAPSTVVILGGGAAGFAAAEMLRRMSFAGGITMISADPDAPVGRPTPPKDFLAGTAPEDWPPLRPADWYSENRIDLRLGAKAVAIRPDARDVELAGGERIRYDRLLLATGAEPVRLDVPGADQPHVHTLRSLRDCRGIIAAAQSARRAVIHL